MGPVAVLSAASLWVPSLPTAQPEGMTWPACQPVAPQVTVGVDSHKDVHVAVAVDHLGRVLGTTWVPTTTRALVRSSLRWATRLGTVHRFGIEGTGSFAAGLSRWLQQRGYQVLEVNRPNRQPAGAGASPTPWTPRPPPGPSWPARPPPAQDGQRHRGDAAGAAGGAPLGDQGPQPGRQPAPQPAGDRPRPAAPAASRAAPARLVQDRGRVSPRAADRPAGRDQVHPAGARPPLPDPDRRDSTGWMRNWPPSPPKAAPGCLPAAASGPRSRGRCWWWRGTTPAGCAPRPPSPCCAASSPLEASSGKTVRHRLNRGGDRDANNALWTIAMTRLSCDERTQRYLARRTAEGKSKREIIRCLKRPESAVKRYIAREVSPGDIRRPSPLAGALRLTTQEGHTGGLPGPHRPGPPLQACWSGWTTRAGGPMWSPHPAATPPATPTGGSADLDHPLPQLPERLRAELERPPPPHRPPRCWSGSPPPAGRAGLCALGLGGRAGPRRRRPGRPTATGSCGSRAATCSTSSPPAPSTRPRSSTGCSRPAERCGLLAEEPRQTHRTLASARQVGLDHPPADPRARQPRPHPPALAPPAASGGRRAGPTGEEVMAMAAAGHAGRLTCSRGGRVPPPSRARAHPTTRRKEPAWAATPP